MDQNTAESALSSSQQAAAAAEDQLSSAGTAEKKDGMIADHESWQNQSQLLSAHSQQLAKQQKKNQDALFGLGRHLCACDRQKERLNQQVSWLMRQLNQRLRDTQAGDQTDLESEKIITQVQDCRRQISQLDSHIHQLENIRDDYEKNQQTCQEQMEAAEIRQKQLQQESGIPEIIEGGSFNPEAVITPQTRLPDFQPVPDSRYAGDSDGSNDADDVQSGSEEPAGFDDWASDRSDSQDPARQFASDQPNISVLDGEHEHSSFGLKTPAESKSGSSGAANTGGARGKLSFHKACPAETIHAADAQSPDVESGDFLLPVHGTVSAGTWAYPGGAMHLGLDMAAPIGTPVQAPANGIVLYADTPAATNCGYLGNFIGWPYGSGNSISLLCAVNGNTYAISLFHLSNIFYVHAGQQVSQGDIIALSGNSGNSTGPHTHIEVFALSCSFEQAVSYFSAGADFAFGCGWEAPATCSSLGCRIRPESVFF